MGHAPRQFPSTEGQNAGLARVGAGMAALLLLASCWLTHANLARLEERDRVGQQVRDEAEAAETLLATMTDAETGQRGYVITGAPDFLEPYRQARLRLPADLAQLARVVPDDPADLASLSRLRALAAAKLAVSADIIAARQAGRSEAAQSMVRSRRGKTIMDALRAEVAAMGARSDARRAQAQARAAAAENWVGPIGLAALGSLILGGFGQEWLRQRRVAAADLAVRARFTQAFGLTSGMLRDLDGKILFWGNGMAALYGYPPGTAVGAISHTLLATVFPCALADIDAELLAIGEWRGELVHRCRDGSLRNILSHWVLHRDPSDGRLTVIEMNFDASAFRRTETHLQLALDASRMGTWIWEVRGKERVTWDARTKAIFGLPPDCVPSYALWQSIVLPEDLPGAMASVDRLLDPADPCAQEHYEYRVRHQDGSVHAIEAYRIAQYVPDPSVPAGQAVLRLIGAVRDVTKARQAALERARTAALLATIIETIAGPVYAKDRQGKYLLANAACLAIIGKAWPEVAGRTDLDVLDDAAQAEAVTANDFRILASGETEILEERFGCDNGQTRTWISTKAPMRAADGQVIGLVGVSVDITDRTRAETLRNLMIHELNHRVKNTLATVQAVAAETLRDAPPHLFAALEGRLLALAAVHDVLTREHWHSADMGEVVAGALAPFGDGDLSRFQVRGPNLKLQPRAAVALGMGLHELATNASKYGALLAQAGRVTVVWHVTQGEAPRLHLAWTESGGPPVAAHLHRGFGTSMIEGPLASDLGGTARLVFDPNGVRCVIDAPLEDVAVRSAPTELPNVGVM